jgi:hypothetical protein
LSGFELINVGKLKRSFLAFISSVFLIRPNNKQIRLRDAKLI